MLFHKKVIERNDGGVLNSRWFMLYISTSLTKLCSDNPLSSFNSTFLLKIAKNVSPYLEKTKSGPKIIR